jgi:drug/metabolite transporter (DMT)-like permease
LSTPRPPAVPLLALSSVAFGAMVLLAKLATPRVPGSEIAFVRFLVGCVAVGAVALTRGLRAHNWRGLAMRGAFGGGAVLFLFMSLDHLPAGLATLLNYTSPVFTVMWAALFLGERIGPHALLALGVTSTGVVLVIRGHAAPGSLGFSPWVCVGVLSAVLSGAAVATIREVRRTDGPWEIFGAFCVVGAAITGVPALRHWVPPAPREWLLMVGVGLLALLGQILMTWSLRHLKAGLAGVIMQLTPVSAFILGWLFLDERAAGLALAGAAITVTGVIWGARIAAREEPTPGP